MFLRILSVFILSFSIFSTSFLTFGNLSRDGVVYAQEEEATPEEEETEEITEEEAEPSVVLLSVMINNEAAELIDGDTVLVKADDAVRLAGSAEPNSEVYVYFAEKELTTTAREDGYWFVLFSITNMENGQYVVRAGDGELEEAEKILTLVLGDSDSLVDPLEDSKNIIKIITETKTSYIVPIILVPLSFVLGWVLGVLTSKKGKVKRKKSKK
ncbi:MAG: hypothetical protein WCY37_00880 [Candidatus Dojkabacteria bacterium]